MDRNLALELVRATEAAALAAARYMGKGDPKQADAAASEDKQAADRLLQNLGTGTPSTAHTHNADNPDYDGFGDDTRHQPKP